jgi:NAD(P)-dependent dehydrogenase (short-subunit alcohol dehydrogenase family)
VVTAFLQKFSSETSPEIVMHSELLDIPREQLEKTFASNIFGYFYMAKAALPHLKDGAAIINTASVTAYKGNRELLDYS